MPAQQALAVNRMEIRKILERISFMMIVSPESGKSAKFRFQIADRRLPDSRWQISKVKPAKPSRLRHPKNHESAL
jgi:hypothetical protein